MKSAFHAVLILCPFFAINQSFADDFTLKIHRELAAASKQYCYTDFEIDLDGNWTAKSTYSNGHQVDSIRLYSVMTVKAKDGKDVLTIPQNHHVKGSYGGSAREERTSVQGKLPSQVAQLISSGKTAYSCRKVSDIDFEKLKQAVEVAEWVLSLE